MLAFRHGVEFRNALDQACVRFQAWVRVRIRLEFTHGLKCMQRLGFRHGIEFRHGLEFMHGLEFVAWVRVRA